MADVVGEGKAVLTADTSQHDAALVRAAKVAEREAIKAQKAAEREAIKATKVAEREAAKAAKAAETAAKGIGGAFAAAAKSIQSNQLISQLETVSSLFIQVGGSVSRAASLVTSSIRPVATASTLLNALGGEALTAAAGFGILGAGVLQLAELGLVVKTLGGYSVELADAAEESAESLRKQGFWVGPEAQAQLDRYTEATRQLGFAFDELKVQAGAPVASELGVITKTLADNARGAIDTATNLSHLGDRIIDRVAPPIGLLRDGLRWGESSLYHALTDTTRATLDQDVANEKLRQSFQEFGPFLDNVKGGAPKPVAVAAPTKADEDAARARAAILAQVGAEQAQIDQIVGLSWLHLDATHEKYTVDAAQDEHDLTLEILGNNAKRKASDDALARAKRAQIRQIAELEAQSVANTAGNFASLASSVADSYQARIDAGEHLSRKEAQAANAALQEAEALQIAQAGITAAVTFSSGLASLQLMGVPPPVAIPLAVAEGASSFAATVAGIRAHRPASFSWRGDTSAAGNPGTGGAGFDPITGEGQTGGKPTGSSDDTFADGTTLPGKGRGGTTDRSSHGTALGLTPEASRFLRSIRRAGKRHPSGRL